MHCQVQAKQVAFAKKQAKGVAMTGPNREAQIEEVSQTIMSGARKAIAVGYPAAAVIAALREVADRLEGKG